MTPIHFGAAYYPEHWPESRWPEDIRLMREAGVTVVRMAEFAWSSMEPAPGKFRFDWLERAVALLGEAGIRVVLGTPSAAPPAWLIEQHPDILPVKEDGQRAQFGNRCHYCVTSPEMHAAAKRIAQAMAKRFGGDANVIGWQIDNEYNRVCFCARCQERFQAFLEESYGTLEALNQAWSTAYWSQTYTKWSQIPLPHENATFPGVYHNPGLLLEHKRFIGASYRAFQKLQIDALRPHLHDKAWITHNFMGAYGGFDHNELSADLDLASWDWYIGTGHHEYHASGAVHDLTRGFKRRNFWLMETQPGSVNWSPVNNMLDRGEARAMAWHAVGHGADALLYWQWRPAAGGQEQYHGSLIDQSGRPRPFYGEAAQIGAELRATSDLLGGSTIRADVAMLTCYESRWSLEWQRHHGRFDYLEFFGQLYQPLAELNLPVDVIPADAPLDGYRLVIVPALAILDDGRAARLEEFVRRGGHLLLTIRTGVKDRRNALQPSRPPGALAEAAGVEVEEYYALDEPVPVQGNLFGRGEAHVWAERLRVLDEAGTTVMATFGEANGWLDDCPAFTVHPHGKGVVYMLAASLDEIARQATIEHVVQAAGLRPMRSPRGVEICTRTRADGVPVYILINHEKNERQVSLPWPVYEHLNEIAVGRELILPGYGVAVVTEEKAEESHPG
jgi:beta-galactosidase